jgi:hypothetical protein
MLCCLDGPRGFALQTVEQHGLALTELELGLQVGAALVAVIVRIAHSQNSYYNIRRP